MGAGLNVLTVTVYCIKSKFVRHLINETSVNCVPRNTAHELPDHYYKKTKSYELQEVHVVIL